MTNFRPTDRLTGFLMPPSVDEWLPQAHLARFVAEVVDGLDLSAMSKTYRGSGVSSASMVSAETLSHPLRPRRGSRALIRPAWLV